MHYHAAMIRRNSDLEIHLPDADAPSSADIIDPADIEMLTSDDEKQILTLPPHIAARFYRRSGSARRASDKLSRRGSVSSIHSHHSNTSAHGGPQSDHLAQHLRRASILESRKARLADRAAHAEKVRLRAAVAKAATRNLQREERALAAQQARERLLAEITAKCEDEVRRAKKKAEETRELKAAKHARLRLEMAEKFAEAEKRRLQYQQTHRRPRTTSLPAGEESKMVKTVLNSLTRDAAARIVQKAWKNYVARRVIDSFRSLDLSQQKIGSMSFDDVSALLSKEAVLETMARVLRLCGLQDMEGGAMGERGAVRTFLSSYLILSHPSAVMSSDGEQEQDLIEKARDLVVSFEQITKRLLRHQSITSMSSELQVLGEAYSVFFSAFHAWKTHDSTVLIEIMLAQFVELELIWQTVKEDRAGGAADEYYQGIRHNQILLLARLKRLAGPDKALDMVKQALRKAKREKKRSKSSKQSIPRSAAVSTNADAHADSVSTPISETFNNVESAVLHELDKQRLSPHESFTKALTALPENRVLVHELLINREFRIEQTQFTEPRQQIMKHMTDMMRSDVDAGLGTKWIVAMATVIQDRLLRSLRPGNSLHVLISEALDPKLIENQCEAGTFSYDSFFDFMCRILPQLCAPFRDPEVKAFAENKTGDPIDRLSRLMGIIDLLSLDHTNFMIQVAAPQLIQEAPGYEQRTFQKGLEDGTITLERTKRFWQKNHNLVVDDMKRRDPEIAERRQVQPPAAKVYAQGLVDLVLNNAPVPSDLVPETLELDNARLEMLHMTAFKIAATAAILLTAKNLLKRDSRSQWKAEADRIMSLDFTEIKPERIQSIIESTRPMPAAARSQLLSTMRRVLSPIATATTSVDNTMNSQMPSVEYVSGPISSSASSSSASTSAAADSSTTSSSFTDPVARLILSRLRAHVLSRLSAASASERVRATTTASQSLAAAGMPEFVNEVGKLVDELGKVRDVDWTCHGLVYERVISESVSS
jgi:hypothetical protein